MMRDNVRAADLQIADLEAQVEELTQSRIAPKAEVAVAKLKAEELQERVWLLEALLRDIHHANADEVDQAFDNAIIAKAFGCGECLDTGVVGGNPKGDENDSCCAMCDRGGNPMAFPKPAPTRVTVTREQMEHARDNPGEAWNAAMHPPPMCGQRDPYSPRACTLPRHHDGEHKDINFKARWIDTDKGWP